MTKYRLLLSLSWLVIPTAAYFLGTRQSATLENQITSAPESRSRPLRKRDQSQSSEAGQFFQNLLKMDDSRQFQAMFRSLLSDPNQAMEFDPTRHDALLMLSDTWGAQNPAEAVAALNELEIPDDRNPYLFFALAQWAEQDPEKALAWLKSNYAEGEVSRLYLTAATIRGLVRTNPDLAYQELLAMPASPEQRGAVDFLLRVWSQKGGENLFTKISAIPEANEALRGAAFQKAMNFMATEDLSNAYNWSAEIHNASERLTAQKAVASVWAQRDPEMALEWAEALSEDDVNRGDVLGRVVTFWTREDPEAASEWIESKQGKPGYDQSARAIAWNSVGYDHQRAFINLTTITDPDLQLKSFDQIGQMWVAEDPYTAREFFETTDLIPDDIRFRLLSNFY